MAKRSSTKKKSSTPVQGPTWDEIVINKLSPYITEIVGIGIVLIVSVTAMALGGLVDPNTSRLLLVWVNFWQLMTGWLAIPIALCLIYLGLRLALRRLEIPGWPMLTLTQRFGALFVILSLLPLTHLITGVGLGGAYAGKGGGWLGLSLTDPLIYFLGDITAWAFYLALAGYGLALFLQIKSKDVQAVLREWALMLRHWADELYSPEPGLPLPAGGRPTIDRKKMDELQQRLPLNQKPKRAAAQKPKARKKKPRKKRRNPNLPPLDLLQKGESVTLSPDEIERNRAIIQKTLEDFDIQADVLENPLVGPAITQFAVVPRLVEHILPDGSVRKTKVRVSKIASLKQDLALSLAAPRVRIQAPVPGQGIVGIEVPNSSTAVVRLGDILATAEFNSIRNSMGGAVGLDVSGTPVATDVTKLPHMLVAGQTGSGKSVFINALITCLVMNNTPEELQLVMIDPKKVELIRFNGLPHLLGKVEVEGERSIGVLRWLTAEMDDRYQKLAAVGARNISGYNEKIKKFPDTKPMPYLVAFIDELADLMVQYGGELERALCRLAQMARATGIHLVVATQRPSTDVLTGLIKANFPARASFAVASGTDSRVILDSIGAESLLGRGDMLFLAADASSPQRVQGCFVTDDEIEKVVAFWKENSPTPRGPAPWDSLIDRQEFLQEKDDMLERAVALAKKYDSISSSMLQRRLRIGYPRAARLMEELFDLGLVDDPQMGGRTRKSLVEDGVEDPLKKFVEQQGDEYRDYPDKPDFDNLTRN